jgi:hypothetical protein
VSDADQPVGPGVEPTTPGGPGRPTRRIVTVRDGRALRWGWAAIGLGIVLVAIGGLVGVGSQVLQVASAEGRARVGNPVTFDARQGTTYAITLIPDPTTADFVEERVGQLGCRVEHPDGDAEPLDASSSAVRTSTSIGVYATDFEGRGGPTTVVCEWERSGLGGSYAVARTHTATRWIGTGVLLGGIVLGLAGVGLLVRGYRGRPQVQELDPAGPGA